MSEADRRRLKHISLPTRKAPDPRGALGGRDGDDALRAPVLGAASHGMCSDGFGIPSMVNHQPLDAVRPNPAGLWSQRPFGTFGGMAAAYSKARRAQCTVAGVSRIDAGSDT